MPRIRAATIDEHKTLTRSALLAAARELIEHDSSADISLAEVALAAGVGRTTFYDYFTDRDDVIASLVEDELPVVIRNLIASVPRGLSTVEHLATLAVRTIEFVAEDRVFGVILHRDVGKMGPEAQERIRVAHSELATELANLYGRGVREGVFRAMPAAVAGRLIQDVLMAGARLLITRSASREDVARHVRDFLLGGLGHMP
jgi:AcrR family transcriptional regulator